jgi:hypothetical protein
MKSPNNFRVRYRCFRSHSFSLFYVVLILFFTSCTSRPEPYSILEFTGAGDVSNYSKSFLLMLNKSDSVNPTAIIGSRGDMFMCNEYTFVYNGGSAQNRFLIKSIDNVVYVNDKINSIDIPGNDEMIPWFKNMKERDFSALQFLSFKSQPLGSYLPYLTTLAKIKPDVGLSYTGNLEDMAGLFKIFNPRVITGPSLFRSDYDQLSKLTNLEILMVSLNDSVITDPLPPMPELEQLFMTGMNENVALTNNFLINNKQIERVIIQKSGSLDFSILNPLDNLKELVVNVSDAIINFDLINNHNKIEVLSFTGDKLVYNLDHIRLPFLRWMTFSSNVTQEEFNSFVDTHPDLEVIELIKNDTISSLQALSKLSKLFGLTVTDTVTDITSIKTLTNLRYLSLPNDFLNDTINKAEIQKSLPTTRIVGNEGFCLGSGWLLFIIPLVLILRFFGRQKRQKFQDGIKS